MLYHPEPQNYVQIRVGLQLSYTWILILGIAMFEVVD